MLFKPVWFSFIENLAELVFAHWNERLSRAHQILSFVVISRTSWTRRNMKYQDGPVGMSNLLNVHTKAQNLEQFCFHLHWLSKSVSSDYWSRGVIANSE